MKSGLMIRKIFIMAGGTGGHIFPGIAIGDALKKQNINVLWLGSLNGLETDLVPKAGFPLFTLNISGFRGKKIRQKLLMPYYLLNAIYQAIKIFRKTKPDAVLSMGGFAAGPGGIAAKLLGIPLYVHEQNSIAGFTNKILAKLAKKTFCAFPNVFTHALLTGNPVREDIINLAPKVSPHRPLRLLILGGSRGAKVLNENIPKALKNLSCEIIHQTGKNSEAHYDFPATVVPFIDDMAKTYDWADIIICRAGALTIAEITAVGIPAILIPYPHAVDDHQTVNAKYLTQNNAALIIPQSELSKDKLLHSINQITEKYEEMASASRALGIKNATQKIIEEIL